MEPTESQWSQGSIPVTRGIRNNKVDTKNLGSHWTTDQNVAHYFQNNGSSRMPFRGTASIKAEVPATSLETDAKVLAEKRVGDTQNHEGGPMNESEVTVRKGAPIKVRSITTVGPKKPTRISKDIEKKLKDVAISTDYQKPGDEEILDKAYKTLQRKRTRSFTPPREMKA